MSDSDLDVPATLTGASGDHTVELQVTNDQGAVSTSAPITYDLDTSTPSAPTVSLDDDTSGGSSLTSNPNLLITAAPNSELVFFTQSGQELYFGVNQNNEGIVTQPVGSSGVVVFDPMTNTGGYGFTEQNVDVTQGPDRKSVCVPFYSVEVDTFTVKDENPLNGKISPGTTITYTVDTHTPDTPVIGFASYLNSAQWYSGEFTLHGSGRAFQQSTNRGPGGRRRRDRGHQWRRDPRFGHGERARLFRFQSAGRRHLQSDRDRHRGERQRGDRRARRSISIATFRRSR